MSYCESCEMMIETCYLQEKRYTMLRLLGYALFEYLLRRRILTLLITL